jgi:hypothetical protein
MNQSPQSTDSTYKLSGEFRRTRGQRRAHHLRGAPKTKANAQGTAIMAMFFAGLKSEEKLIAAVLRQKAGVRQTTTWRSIDNRAASIRS